MTERQPPTYIDNQCYEMSDLRLEMRDVIAEGGVAFHQTGVATEPQLELKVTPSATVMQVSVAAGGVFIKSAYAEPGMYHGYNDAAVEVELDTADALLPRIDTIVARITDPEFEGGDPGWVLDSITGTATVGANLTNLTGKAVLTGITCEVLAYVLVNANQAALGVFPANQILDVRDTFTTAGPATAPYCVLVASVTTTAITVPKKIDLATTEHVDSAFFSVAASVITILKSGIFDVGALSMLTAAAGNMEISITKNGLTDTVAATRAGSVVQLRGTPSQSLVALNRGDTIQLTGESTNAAVTSDGANFHSRLWIRKVG